MQGNMLASLFLSSNLISKCDLFEALTIDFPLLFRILNIMNHCVSNSFFFHFHPQDPVAQYRHHYFSASIVIPFVMPETATIQRLNTIYIHINH